MHELSSPHYRTDVVNGVTVFRILDTEVRDPGMPPNSLTT